MTPAQRAVYDAVLKIQERGKRPTMARIRLELGIRSRGTVHAHLKRMEKSGYCRLEEDGVVLYPIETKMLTGYGHG